MLVSWGEAETAGFVLSGKARIYYGENFKEYMDFGSTR